MIWWDVSGSMHCRYEQAQREKGRKQSEIRKPRFMEASGNPSYPDGSKSVECALCPIKRGLFKQTVASHPQWVHLVCALWQTPEMVVPQADQSDIVRHSNMVHLLLTPAMSKPC